MTDSPNSRIPLTAHVIRLLGPWEFEVLGHSSGALGDHAGVIRLPADWSRPPGSHCRGRVRFTRRFGCPTNIDGEHVDLVVETAEGVAATVTLNQERLGELDAGAGRFDVTGRLQRRNELSIVVVAETDAPAALTDTLQLEILPA